MSLAVGARTALQEIEGALWRIEQGTFGSCATCGTELELQVLETLPQTARCLGCQRAGPRLTRTACGRAGADPRVRLPSGAAG